MTVASVLLALFCIGLAHSRKIAPVHARIVTGQFTARIRFDPAKDSADCHVEARP